jgi:phenylalanyl-tRNA synthetase beta chain
MGGGGSEVSDATARVLLESAYFDPRSVRRTAKRLQLHSESSHRFERGVDPNGADFASARAATLLAELGGGKIARAAVDVYPKKIAPLTIDLRVARANAVLGLSLGADEMARTLGALELGVAPGTAGLLRVTAPTFRPDLEREIDLVEEIGRVHLEQIPATLPRTTAGPSGSGEPLVEKVRDALTAAGLDEAILYSFTSPARISALRFPDGHPVTRPLPLRNPLREDHTVMRTSLLPNLLAATAHNLKFGVTDVRIFEVGHVFLPSGRTLPDEPRIVSGILCGDRAGWLKPSGPIDFYDAKGIVERLFAALMLPVEMVAARNEDGFLHPGVGAAILYDGQHVGVVGELHPETRDRAGIDRLAFAFEVNLELLPPLAPAQARPIDRFPSVVRDVSFFVTDSVPAAKIRALLAEGAPAILETISVLDDYREAGKVPAGKKGMLWSITYRAPDRTLTDAEVDAAHEAIVKRVLSALGAERR